MPAVLLPYRLLLDDIDAAGVVFGPRLIAIAHRAAEEVLAGIGVDFAAILRDGRFALPIVKLSAEFLAPLIHGESVTLAVACTRIGGGSFTITTEVRTNTGTAAQVVQVQAAYDRIHKTGMTLPLTVRSALERILVAE